MARGPQDWHQCEHNLTPRNYTCGHCGMMVGTKSGYHRPYDGNPPNNPRVPLIYICPFCGKPTFFEGDTQVPGVAFGAAIDNLPPEVGGLYQEARNCLSVSANTASALAARKLLMNVAADMGATHGETFQYYIGWLETNGYVPPKARGWIDHIRKKGNEATHKIPAISRQDAEELITFTEMILKLIYDYPARVPTGNS